MAASSAGGRTCFSTQSSRTVFPVATDSLAVLRIRAWSSFDSVSQTFLENTSTSGTIECSVVL